MNSNPSGLNADSPLVSDDPVVSQPVGGGQLCDSDDSTSNESEPSSNPEVTTEDGSDNPDGTRNPDGTENPGETTKPSSTKTIKEGFETLVRDLIVAEHFPNLVEDKQLYIFEYLRRIGKMLKVCAISPNGSCCKVSQEVHDEYLKTMCYFIGFLAEKIMIKLDKIHIKFPLILEVIELVLNAIDSVLKVTEYHKKGKENEELSRQCVKSHNTLESVLVLALSLYYTHRQSSTLGDENKYGLLSYHKKFWSRVEMGRYCQLPMVYIEEKHEKIISEATKFLRDIVRYDQSRLECKRCGISLNGKLDYCILGECHHLRCTLCSFSACVSG